VLQSSTPIQPFTTKQADAILELQLHRLTKLSIDEISNELKSVREAIAEYESILASEAKLRKVIIKELEEVKKLYGDARRTVIEDEAAEIMLEDLIADEQVAVTGQPLRLHEADPDLDLSNAAARRHRTHWHEDARRRFCRASVHCVNSCLHFDLHQHWTRLLAEGV
jgi:DNA gyrase/topoisomerase IV subunit A